MTIIECLLAITILAIVVVAMVDVLSMGQRRVSYAGSALQGVSIGEHLLEEVIAKPFTGTAVSRSQWCVSDYQGFTEEPGDLTDCVGAKYPIADQGFRRDVTVSPGTMNVPGLDGLIVAGKIVSIHVEGPDGVQWSLSRFIAAPHLASP